MKLNLPMETPRLILRSFEDRDTETFALYRSDPEVARYQGWQIPFTSEQAAHFITELKTVQPGEPGEWYQIAIERKVDGNTPGELIGDIAFKVLLEDPRQAEIGFTLARPFQRQGYASEAVRRLLEGLFQELKLHRVCANIDPANLASARLLERMGMRNEGRFVESLRLRGAWVNEDWYAILRREWPE